MIRRTTNRAGIPCLLIALVTGFPGLGLAQEWEDDYRYEDSGEYDQPQGGSRSSVGVRGSFGLTADPSTFQMGLGVPIEFNRNVALTPHMLVGFDDDDTIVAPTLNLEVALDLSDHSDDTVRRLRPYLQLGVGFAYIDRDGNSKNNDETGFLFVPGMGVEYELTENLYLGTNLRFNVMPDDVAGENFFLSWDILSLRVRF